VGVYKLSLLSMYNQRTYQLFVMLSKVYGFLEHRDYFVFLNSTSLEISGTNL
jgi:hypothetical protein